MFAGDFAGSGIIPACSNAPILSFVDNPSLTAATLTTYADGREVMAFMMPCASFSPTCLALGHMAVVWALRGIMPGSRDSLLSIQVRCTRAAAGLVRVRSCWLLRAQHACGIQECLSTSMWAQMQCKCSSAPHGRRMSPSKSPSPSPCRAD